METPKKPASLRSTFETHSFLPIITTPIIDNADEELFLVCSDNTFAENIIKAIIYIHFCFAQSIKFEGESCFMLRIMQKEYIHHIMVISSGNFFLVRWKKFPFAN
jgi:hypothetical protein